MQVGLRHFDSQTLDWFAGALRSGEATRHGLARELCERTGWRNALGRPCLSAAAKALPALAGRVGMAPDIRAVVIDLGRLVGSHPSARQPLPGTKKVWQGLERLHWAIQVRDAIGERKRE